MAEKASRTGKSRGIKAGLSAALAALAGVSLVATAAAEPGDDSAVFVNEIHYDNAGGDVGEFIEVVGPAGTDLGEYSLVLYNGSGGAVYDTEALSGTIDEQRGGYGAESFPISGIQNGAPDGVALEGPDGLIQFLSYEGSFEATNGPADGVTSTDIGVEEKDDTPAGQSLQLTGGPGEAYGDFEWTGPVAETPGQPNTGQTFGETVVEGPEVPDETRIHDIQGAQQTSPLEDQEVTNVPGVITAFRDNGFFMQDPEADDSDATSEGIFVFAGDDSEPDGAFDVGDGVLVSGTVKEFRAGGADGDNLSETRISSSPDRVSQATTPLGDVVPTTITLVDDAAEGDGSRTPPTEVIDDDSPVRRDIEEVNDFQPDQDGIDFYESLEGMSVRVSGAVAVGPASSQGSFGEIAVLPDGGEGASGTRTTRDGITITPSDPNDTQTTLGDDFNPERVIFGDEVLTDRDEDYAIPVTDTGDTYGTLSGIISYSFGNFKAQLTTPPERAETAPPPEVTDEPGEDELSVATYSLRNLSPDQDAGDTTYQGAAGQIVENLRSPDIIGLTEVQDNDGDTDSGTTSAEQTAQSLIEAVEAAGGQTYEYVEIAPADKADGGEPGGNIRVGFLYREDTGVGFVRRGDAGPTDATTFRADGGEARLTLSPGRVDPENPAFENSRKSLAGEFTYNGETVIIVQNHFNSKGGDEPLFGRFQPPRLESEEQRERQAQVVNDFVDDALTADPDAKVIVMGDLNDFEFSRSVETLRGEDDALTNLVDGVAKAERYSFVFDGNSQVLDHMLVTDGLNALDPTYDMVHASADYAGQGSDHDPTVGRFETFADDDGDGGNPDPEPEPDPDPPTNPPNSPTNPNACTIIGTPGNDNLRGTPGRDVICGLGGNDLIRGLGGNDVIRGGPGNDRILGGSGNDRIEGQQGNDALYGQVGNDTIIGGPGNDVLRGGPGRDRLNGGPGRDSVRQ